MICNGSCSVISILQYCCNSEYIACHMTVKACLHQGLLINPIMCLMRR